MTTGRKKPHRSGSDAGRTRLEEMLELHPVFDHTLLDGVILAVNAIGDAGLLLDGPTCGYEKAFLVSGTHDIFSRMFNVGSAHRFHCTEVVPDALIFDRSAELIGRIGEVLRLDDIALLLMASMPMASMTGIDYGAVVRGVEVPRGKGLVLLPESSSGLDWLDGYAVTLESIARNIDLDAGPLDRRAVAVVGYLFDRHEGDHLGNMAELRRILGAMSLETVSVWLDGGGTGDLARAGRAGLVVSLPYGRGAARILADRTGARLLELDLPFGLTGSRQWLGALAEAAGVEERGREIIDLELEKVVPVIDTVLDDHLRERELAFFGDPALAEAVMEGLAEVGCIPGTAIITGTQGFLSCIRRDLRRVGPGSLFRPRYGEVLELDLGKADFIVGNSLAHYLVKSTCPGMQFVEFGYPSWGYHCLSASPFFFFRGFVGFLNRIVNRG